MGHWTFAIFAVALTSASAASAEPEPAAPPASIGRLLACRDLADAAERLGCFDRETGSVADALAKRDLVALDREKVRSTRRSLFGLAVPKLGILDGDDTDQIKQIEGVLAAVGMNRDGGYTFRLSDGARWSQSDDKPIALEPRAGDKVVVKRGLLGSYMMSVRGQPGVKVQRVN